MASLIQYEVLELWHDLLFDRRMREAVPGFGVVSLEQLRSADKYFFEKLGRATRSGCVPNSSGVRPLDALIKQFLESSEVLMHLMPPQASKKGDKRLADSEEPLSTLSRGAQKRQKAAAAKAKGAGKAMSQGKGSGKSGKGKGSGKSPNMPQQLVGGVPKDDQGKSICFGYNLGSCSNANCWKGRHCCCKRGCFGEDHTFLSCPN